MILEHYQDPWEFELLDTGDGFRLEKWGEAVLARPDPQIIWSKHLSESEWNKASAVFQAGSREEKGKWQIKKAFPKPWKIQFNGTRFLLKLSPFKHTGLFAEQAAQWNWMLERLKSPSLNLDLSHGTTAEKPKILNLFAYTGGATSVLAKAGCFVTHVDASKPSLNWAAENHKLNSLPKDTARWILDDAAKFAKRELKRGAQYDGILMDPPAFGHSPTGKTWKFNQDLPGLLEDCARLLSPKAVFLLVNGYATNSSALALKNLLEDAMAERPGLIEYGELCLKQKSGRLISTGIFSRWNRS